ncbi:carbon-nitrogen hydrolase family protein [Chloroflexota bacterium]
MSTLTVAAIQMKAHESKRENLSRAEALLDTAVKKGARIVALPELFNFLGTPETMRANAESIPGPTTDMLCAKARSNKVYILGGSIAEKAGDAGKTYNTSTLINPSGKIIARYSKIHLFDVEISTRVSVKESDTFSPGNKLVTAETGYGVVGLSICYDLRFPELYGGLTLRGAKIIFVPAAFMATTGKDHWEPLLKARAIENQVYVIAPDVFGPVPGTNIVTHGRSLIIDPWGTVLAQAADAEGVITAELDFDYLQRVRAGLPSLAHRKPEVYRAD